MNVPMGMHDCRAVWQDIDADPKLDSNSAASANMDAKRAQVAKAIVNTQPKSGSKPL